MLQLEHETPQAFQRKAIRINLGCRGTVRCLCRGNSYTANPRCCAVQGGGSYHVGSTLGMWPGPQKPLSALIPL